MIFGLPKPQRLDVPLMFCNNKIAADAARTQPISARHAHLREAVLD